MLHYCNNEMLQHHKCSSNVHHEADVFTKALWENIFKKWLLLILAFPKG